MQNLHVKKLYRSLDTGRHNSDSITVPGYTHWNLATRFTLPPHPKFLVILNYHQRHDYINLKQVDNRPRTLISSASGGIHYMQNLTEEVLHSKSGLAKGATRYSISNWWKIIIREMIQTKHMQDLLYENLSIMGSAHLILKNTQC